MSRIFDDSSNVVKNFSDGLPTKATFTILASSKWFELEDSSRKIHQRVVEEQNKNEFINIIIKIFIKIQSFK